MKKKISVLGSTGSIGLSTLEIVSHLNHAFEITCLSTYRNTDLLLQQINQFNPKAVCIVDNISYQNVKKELSTLKIDVFYGREGLLKISQRDDVDLMVNGLVGASGMEPTLIAVQSGIDVALANKESLVMAGNIINRELAKSGSKILPVDSEHSAIWQCLVGEDIKDIRRIILTGSGGPFREREISSFNNITVSEALNHPNWDMGKKISIDSATMMNKGLEVIEAYWLFGLNKKNINIVIHPQSIIHSMVEMIDGAIKAQMGVPDMKVPIQYALTYPRHINAPWERLDFFKCGSLSFQEPDFNRFPCIGLAYKSLERLGTACAALNLANDLSVDYFLKKKIRFTEIPKINEAVLHHHPWVKEPTLDDLKQLDIWVKEYVTNHLI